MQFQKILLGPVSIYCNSKKMLRHKMSLMFVISTSSNLPEKEGKNSEFYKTEKWRAQLSIFQTSICDEL